jgi:hypothetical protein
VVETANLAPLLRQPVRWGWELWPPPPAQLSPERNNPPPPQEVGVISQAKATSDKTPSIILVVAWLIVLSVDASNNFQGGMLGVMGVLGALVAFWAALKRYGNRLLPIIIFTVTGLLFGYISLLVEAFFVYRTPSSHQPELMDPKAIAKADREHAEVVEQWRQRITAFEEAERRRVATADLWYPVPVPPATRLVCAFGGTTNSWAVALLTLGGSLLGSGKRVLIGNLSRRDSTGPLAKLAEACGLTVQRAEIGSRSAHTLFAGLSWADLTDLLVEVANARQRDADLARKERQLDRAVLREVAQCLDESAPTSIRRLGNALKVIQGRRVAEDFSNEEEDRLTGLYNDVQRQHGDVLDRVIRLGLFLSDLEVLDAQPASTNGPIETAPLQLVSVDRRSQALDNELLVDAVFQLLLYGIRTQSSASDVLIVLGTDRISAQQLEMLSEMATQENLQVFLWFEHLRDDAVSLLGTGGAAACFFALTNPREAAAAVEFVGSGYKWIESQRSRSVSESITKTSGTETGTSMSFTVSQPMGSSQTSGESMGTSLSEALGSSQEFSSSEQRVKEELLEPQVLMGLPVTCMIHVEVGQGGTRRIANVDTNPQLTFANRVAAAPRFAVGEASPVSSFSGVPRIQ